MRHALIYGLDDFGLSVGKLKALGDRQVSIRAYLGPPSQDRMIRLPLPVRRRHIRQWYRTSLIALRERWTYGKTHPLGTSQRPDGVRCTVHAKCIGAIRRIPEIAEIWIDGIKGLTKRSPQQVAGWYSVAVRFVVDVEGLVKPKDVEDRVIMVKALGRKDAVRRLRPAFKRYQAPYLNSSGRIVRFRFLGILDVFELVEDTLDPDGTEVYARLWRLRGGRINA